MGKNEIIVLIIVIFITVTFVCFVLNKAIKTKKKVAEKKNDNSQEPLKQESAEELNYFKKDENLVEEVNTETVLEKTEEVDKSKNKKNNVPEISVALQDELNEFREYLKSRITPEFMPKDEPVLHPYDLPKVNRISYEDYINDSSSLYDLPKDLSYRNDDYELPNKKQSKGIEDLPSKVKLLMISNFFDSKF